MSSSPSSVSDVAVTLTAPDQIEELAGDIGLFGSRKRDVRVALASLSADENRALEATIKRHYSACGCGQGRISGVITLLGYLTLVFTGVISVKALGIGKTILLYFACAAVAMVVGKAFALRNARQSLRTLSRQLRTTDMTADIGLGG